MSDLPQPLTPPDCNLRDFAFMPLDVQRLRDSDLAADESPESCWAALLLWCVSWHEVPAGSIPDDDEWIAKRARYWHRGKMDAEWQHVRAGALRGWIRCADGRLYHPVVAEKANKAWDDKHKHAYEKLCERLRKRNKARLEKGQAELPTPTFDQWKSLGRPLESELFPPEEFKFSGGKPPDFHRKKGALPLEKCSGDPEGTAQRAFDEADDSAEHSVSVANAQRKYDSAGKAKSSTGNDDEFRRNAGGLPPENASKSVGIPPEKPLKGEGREGKGEVNLKPSGTSSVSGTSARDAENASDPTPPIDRKRATEIAIRLRAAGIQGANGFNPHITDWAENPKVTDLMLDELLAMAKQRKPNESVNVAYLATMLPDLLNPPKQKAQKPRDDWHRTEAGIQRKAKELGLHPRGTESWDSLKERCFTEIRLREHRAERSPA